MMDKIIEPGDIARAYDFGPTAKRKDSVLTSPVSLFRREDALSRDDARRALGLDLDRPTALARARCPIPTPLLVARMIVGFSLM